MKLNKSEIPELWLTAFPNYKGRTFNKLESYDYSLDSHSGLARGETREVALIDTATGEIIYPYLYYASRRLRVESNIVVAEHVFSTRRDYGINFIVRPTPDF